MRGFNFKKTVQLLNFLAIENGGTINKMKALKLIWLCDRYNLRKFGRTITGDEYFALKNGPVASATRNILEDNDFLNDEAINYSKDFIVQLDKYNYKSTKEIYSKVFSSSDLETINLIFGNFGKLDEFKLSDFSHTFPEWKKYESALTKGLSSRYQINQIDFFLNNDDSSHLFLSSDTDLDISMAVYIENSELISAF